MCKKKLHNSQVQDVLVTNSGVWFTTPAGGMWTNSLQIYSCKTQWWPLTSELTRWPPGRPRGPPSSLPDTRRRAGHSPSHQSCLHSRSACCTSAWSWCSVLQHRERVQIRASLPEREETHDSPFSHLKSSLQSTGANLHWVEGWQGLSSVSSSPQAEPPNWDGVWTERVRNYGNSTTGNQKTLGRTHLKDWYLQVLNKIWILWF